MSEEIAFANKTDFRNLDVSSVEKELECLVGDPRWSADKYQKRLSKSPNELAGTFYTPSGGRWDGNCWVK